MAKIYLDANIYIDLAKKRAEHGLEKLDGHELFISPLTIHIMAYIYKYKIPSKELNNSKALFNLISFSEKICESALVGPTKDFEDNVQLHSAAEADCDYFLTQDKKLLSMKFFGKVQIIKPENLG